MISRIFSASSIKNVSSDATADDWGTGGIINSTPTFVNLTTHDLHLSASDTVAKDQGEDLSGEYFSDDIDGVTRTGTWDIGADEFLASSTASDYKDANNIICCRVYQQSV